MNTDSCRVVGRPAAGYPNRCAEWIGCHARALLVLLLLGISWLPSEAAGQNQPCRGGGEEAGIANCDPDPLPPPPVTGMVSLYPLTCDIAVGASTCQTHVVWATSPSTTTNVRLFRIVGGSVTEESTSSHGEKDFSITSEGARFELRHNSNVIGFHDAAANLAPNVSLTAPAPNYGITLPGSVTFTATASDSDGSISSVKFYRGSTLIGTGVLNGGEYRYVWNSPVEGTHLVKAVATDNNNAITETPVRTLTVTPEPPPPDAPNTASDTVGATNGQFRVDEAGAATYTIPILVAPGTAGVAPEISLSYSSQGGDGPLGPGWSISGTSSISRCRATREAGDFIHNGQAWDGNPGPIRFESSDRFCLDGQRLVAFNPGGTTCPLVSGATATQYRTEVESYQRVCAYTYPGEAGTRFFTVEARDGSKRWYGDRRTSAGGAAGTRQDSILTATAPGREGVIYQWAQTRFQDSVGNFIDYSYEKNPGGSNRPGEQLLSEIAFTGKLSVDGSSETHAPHSKVTFVYQDVGSNHHARAFFSGSEAWRTRRLSAINSFNGSTRIRNYRLGYQGAPSGRFPFVLNWLQECRTSGAAACLEPTYFHWSPAAQQFGAWEPVASIQTGSMSKFEGMKLADVNGNGRQDLVWVKDFRNGEWCQTDGVNVSFSRLDGQGRPYFSTPAPTPLCTPSELISNGDEKPDSSWFLLDYTGDGRDDLFLRTDAGWVGYASRGEDGPAGSHPWDESTNLLQGIHIPASNDPYNQPQLTDVNGDGLTDIVYFRNGALYARVMQRDGANGFKWGAERSIVPFHADDNVCQGFVTGLATCSYTLKGLYQKGNGHQLIDFNGDSRSDLIVNLDVEVACGGGGGGGGGGYDPDPLPPQQPHRVEPEHSISSSTCTVGRTVAVVLDEVPLNASSPIRYRQYGGTSWGGAYAPVVARSFVDTNGDGLSEIVSPYLNGIASAVNTGIGYLQGVSYAGEMSRYAQAQLVDINGDGRADVVYPWNYADEFHVRYAQPDGSFGPAQGLPLSFSGRLETGCAGGPASSTARECLAQRSFLFGDFTGDGNLELLRIRWRDGATEVSVSRVPHAYRGRPRDVITTISTGTGAQTNLTYLPLTNSAVYTKEAGSRNAPSPGRGSPVQDVMGPMYVVARAMSSAPAWNSSSVDPLAKSAVYYHYVGARLQAGGRGFLGFSEIHSIEGNALDHHVATVTHYHQDFPLIGRPHTTQKFVVAEKYDPPPCFNKPVAAECSGSTGNAPPQYDGVLVHHAESEWESYPAFTAGTAQRPFEARLMSTLEVTSDLNSGTALSGVRTSFTYSGMGNTATTRVDTFTSAHAFPTPSSQPVATQTTSNIYTDNPENWILGRLTESTVTYQRPNRPDVVRRTNFGYATTAPHAGLLVWEKVQQGGGVDKELTTYYSHDAFGNRVASYTCSSHFTEAACRTTNVEFQHADPLRIHRYSRSVYDARGRFLVSTHEPFKGPSGTVERQTRHVLARDVYGNASRVRDANGVEARTSVGDLGRVHYTWVQSQPFALDDELGVQSWTTYRWCGTGSGQVGCPTGASYRIQVETSGAGKQWSYVDVLGRQVLAVQSQSRSDIADRRFSGACTVYDAKGRVARQSEPFYVASSGGEPAFNSATCSGHGAIWRVNHYDALSRLVGVDLPGGGSESYAYTGLGSWFADAVGNPSSLERRNVLGEVSLVRDSAGTEMTQAYDAAGNLHMVRRDAGRGSIPTKMLYDDLGRKVLLEDPDAGLHLYHYNAAGEMVIQVDPEGNQIHQWFDARGRVYRKSTRNAAGIEEVVHEYDFDTATNGLGQLAEERTTGIYLGWLGTGGSAHSFERSYSYDVMGRAIGSRTWIDGIAYDSTVEHDALGRPYKSQDATGRWVKNEYSPVNGAVMAVCASSAVDVSATCPTSSSTHLRVIEHDQRGNVVHERRRNSVNMQVFRTYDGFTGRLVSVCAGSSTSNCQIQEELYKWDFNGRLEERVKAGQYVETFTYDELNRLRDSTYESVGGITTNALSQSMVYDELGNVCRKIVDGVATPFEYGGKAGCGLNGLPGNGTNSLDSPHAVTRVGDRAYEYDARGNQTRAVPLSGGTAYRLLNTRTIRYSLENQAYDVMLGSTSSPAQRTRFWYGPDGNRYKREDASGRMLYIGNVEISVSGGMSTIRRYVAGVMVQEIQNGGTQERFLFHDHLGSVVRVTNTSGSVVEGTDFGAFGERRGFSDPRLSGQALSTTPRGYTGHEHLENFGIVHMNGRIYEARLGRFLQADPYVQEPRNLQNYNRYTYVWNNPLNATDPSGYLGIKERQWLGTTVAIVGAAFGQYWAAGMATGGASVATVNAFTFYWGAAVGAVSGGISTQSTSGALWGAFSGAAFASAGNYVRSSGYAQHSWQAAAAHGSAAGLVSVMQGGNAGHAFLTAGLSKYAMGNLIGPGDAFGGVKAAIIGGSVSAMTGGKFANGAATAALQFAVNQALSSAQRGLNKHQHAAVVRAAKQALATIDPRITSDAELLSAYPEARHIWPHKHDFMVAGDLRNWLASELSTLSITSLGAFLILSTHDLAMAPAEAVAGKVIGTGLGRASALAKDGWNVYSSVQDAVGILRYIPGMRAEAQIACRAGVGCTFLVD